MQDGKGGSEAVSDVLVSEGSDGHFVDSREKNFSESLVGAIVLVEECGGGVESIAKFRDLGASGVGWDDGYRAGVDGHDEGDRRKSVVYGGDTVSWRRPRLTQPRLDWIEAAFEFNFKLTSAMVL